MKLSTPALLIRILVIVGIYLTSLYNYLLFHTLAELFAIVVAFSIFVLAWNTRRFRENQYLQFIGIAYLFVGLFDLFHTLAYEGMGVFPAYGPNLPTQLWIIARYIESISLLLALTPLAKKMNWGLVFGGYVVISGGLLATTFYWPVFPACYIEGVGLTPFKWISEYVICAILLAAFGLLLQRRHHFDPQVVKFLGASIVVTIASELAFTAYINVYGPANLIGHLLKLVSFYLIYQAVIVIGLMQPYILLFRDLKQSQRALQENKKLLESQVEERTRELQQANQQLREEIAEREEALTQAAIYRGMLGKMLRHLRQVGHLSERIMFQAGQELAVQVQANAIPEFLEAFDTMGLGQLTLIEADPQRLRWVFQGDNLVENQADSDRPTGDYTRGFLCGLVSQLNEGVQVSSVETNCQSMGDQFCCFIVQALKGEKAE